MREVTVYTDGGCHGNPGPGGWAYVIEIDDDRTWDNGYHRATTNNRMELQAVISALEHLIDSGVGSDRTIRLHTDSQYVKRGITEWIGRWVANGWRTSGKKDVKNRDLWEHLLRLTQNLRIEWEWVRGHDGVELNELCDDLVQQAIGTAGK